MPDLNTVYDVVIVGTGMAGALAAYRLSEDGIKVHMVEAGDKLPEENQRLEMRKKYAASFSKSQTSP